MDTSPLVTFDCISDFSDHVKALHENGIEKDYSGSQKEKSKSWDNNTDFETALDMGCNGGVWSEGAKKIKAVELPDSSFTDDLQRSVINTAIVGCAPCVPNALAGVPDSMFEITEQPQKQRVIRFAVEVARPCDTVTTSIMNQGTALLSIIDALETSGVSVELWAVHHQQSGTKTRLEICVKRAGEFWSADTVAFALCHPAFFRRLGFMFVEATPVFKDCCPSAYGNAVGAKYSDFDVSTPYIVPSECRSLDGAIRYYTKYVTEQLKAAQG